ncbi:glycosyltransferase family 2 protein [Enterococcus gallinarum]|uniref:glycosyltransferase family 2 protein n=1 Tax=Enterococcus TaxID=1350 RepID=UPI003F77769C
MVQKEISVVIPYYSKFTWLEEALESLNNQTYKDFEVIIVNDGSNDNLNSIINRGNYFFELIILEQENKGPAAARNHGILYCKSKYVAFLDSDDIWLPRKLELQYKFMEKNKSIWSQHSYKCFYENGDEKSIDTSKYKDNVFIDTFVSFKVQTSCVMVRRNALFKEGKLIIKYREDQRYGQDLFFYRDLAERYKLDCINEYLTLFRIRGNNAGFRASVQLYSKANTWIHTISIERELNLPGMVKAAYWLSWRSYILLNNLYNGKINEIIAGLFYFVPYGMLKSYNFFRKKV